MTAVTSGTLVVIGGGEDRTGPCDVLRRFTELAGGREARIVVIGAASSVADQLGAEYVAAFESIGCEDVVVLPMSSREAANDPEALSAIEKATGVFFTGGDQWRIATIVGGSETDTLLHEMFEQGLVVAGTSAGAAMMSTTMILGGGDRVPTPAVRTGPGLGFVSGVVVDMHFAERGRISRLLGVVAMYPHELGLGIDEDTAVVLTGNTFQVIGSGTVVVVDAGTVTNVRMPPADVDAPIAMTGVTLHVLPSGYEFELRTRTPVITTAPEGAVALHEGERR